MRQLNRHPRLRRFALAMEVVVFATGAFISVSSLMNGESLSRPGMIALAAGAVGLLATLTRRGTA